MNKSSKNKKRGSKKTKQPKSVLDRIKQFSIGDAADFAYNAYNAVGKLSGWNSEVKFVDTTRASATVSSGGDTTAVSLIAEGSTVSQRDGESVRAHGLELRISGFYNNTAAQNSIRCLVVVDAESNGAVPAVTDVLETVGTGTSLNSPWAHLGAPRFDVVLDETFNLGLSPSQFVATRVIPLHHHVRFTGAGGAIANAKEGNVFVLLFSDVITNMPSAEFTTRFHYVDN